MLKEILTNIILPFLFFFFSYLIPKKKNLLFFGQVHGCFWDNTKYLFLYANKYHYLENYFLVKDFSKVPKKFLSKYNFVKRRSLKHLWLILRADYLFVNVHGYDMGAPRFLLGRFKIVNLMHGSTFKQLRYSPDFMSEKNTYNKKFLSSKYTSYFFKKELKNYHLISSKSDFSLYIYKYALQNKNVKVMGYPRNDIFFNSKSFDKKLFLKSLGLNGYKKIFLYLPTWRHNFIKFTPFSNNFLDKLNNHFKKKNYLFLIKRHPICEYDLNKSHSNIIELDRKDSNLDVQELLIAVDVLISDYSSVGFDFVLLKKPLITFFPDYKDFTTKILPLFSEIEKLLPDSICYRDVDLFKYIKNINFCTKSSKYKKSYKHFLNTFNTYQDGNSSKRILSTLKLI